MMKIFDTLTSRNFELFASQHYNNPECIEVEEFKEDLTRFKYLKRLLSRYEQHGDLQERLILNHIIVLYNVFGIVPATRLLFFRMGDEFHSVLKTFLVYLSVFPEGDNEIEILEADLLSIPLDKGITEILRKI